MYKEIKRNKLHTCPLIPKQWKVEINFACPEKQKQRRL